ncbi:MAG: histidine kinase, partial [Gammaproteobacteria bacterium]|nr:histidine kinase [Gammaproteobacteria bacterium]
MMNPTDTVEYNSLNWVKKELDLVLDDAQKAFNIYIDDTSETDKLQECIDQIHLIHGTLLMVELYGAAMLAEEIEILVKAMLNDEVSGNEEIYQLIMGAMLRLPDYLDGLVSGNKDIPIVLLPVLNDLRAARNESLLSESLLFFPDVDSDDVTVEDIVVDAAHSNELQSLAKRLRPHFQLGLLTWFKNEKPLSGLKRIQ